MQLSASYERLLAPVFDYQLSPQKKHQVISWYVQFDFGYIRHMENHKQYQVLARTCFHRESQRRMQKEKKSTQIFVMEG